MIARGDAGGRSRRLSTRDDPQAREDAASFVQAGASIVAESSGLYRLLVDSVVDYAIFALDTEGNIISWNLGAQRLKGYAPADIIGRHFSIFYPSEDVVAGKPDRELHDALRDGRVEDEGWRIRKDGTRFWANVTIVALRDASGAHVGFAKVTRDLTERWRAEEALRQSEERFRLLIQGVHDYAILMLDPEGRVISWNSGAETLKGYRADEIIGRHFSIFYPPEDVNTGRPEMELKIARSEGRYEEEGWRVRKDGTRFWANVVVTPIHGAHGRLIGFAKVTRDLTERRALQERAIADARRLAEAEASSRTKSEFLAALSHELRTPINATLGYSELISMGVSGPVTEQQRDYLQRIKGSQEHLLGIIVDLLNYSKIEAGQLHLDIGPVHMIEVLDRVLHMIEPQATMKRHTVRRTCADNVTAIGDRAKIEQILLNLLSNAVKFTPPDGRIEVKCRAFKRSVVVTVTDTGPGIPETHHAEIFKPFVQLGRSLTSAHEGTGLGLAISRELARAMGGDVTVESEEGKGASFKLTLKRGMPKP